MSVDAAWVAQAVVALLDAGLGCQGCSSVYSPEVRAILDKLAADALEEGISRATCYRKGYAEGVHAALEAARAKVKEQMAQHGAMSDSALGILNALKRLKGD